MTRQLAQDAYRYVSRVYVNERQQCAKMMRKHGADQWRNAYYVARDLHAMKHSKWCAAKIIDAIAAELPER